MALLPVICAYEYRNECLLQTTYCWGHFIEKFQEKKTIFVELCFENYILQSFLTARFSVEGTIWKKITFQKGQNNSKISPVSLHCMSRLILDRWLSPMELLILSKNGQVWKYGKIASVSEEVHSGKEKKNIAKEMSFTVYEHLIFQYYNKSIV